jgi:hypothetical protein
MLFKQIIYKMVSLDVVISAIKFSKVIVKCAHIEVMKSSEKVALEIFSRRSYDVIVMLY